jgi:hypothetical protein
MIRKECTADASMPGEDRHKYFWIHADAQEVGDFFNLKLYQCPHCGLTFHAPPRDQPI